MKMIETRIKNQRGTVLVISLVFLLVLTLVAVVAMQSTVMEQKISSNTAFKTKAFESSEAPRPQVSDVLDHHVFERGWPDTIVADNDEVKAVEGLSVVAVDNDMFMTNEDGEDIVINSAGLTRDMDYEREFNSPIDNDVRTLNANIYVYRNASHALPGHSAAMVSGYEGTGKSLAGSGAGLFFDVRSVGTSDANARSATAADSRIIIRN